MRAKKDRNLSFKDGKWYLDLTFRGKLIRKSIGYDIRQALAVLALARGDIVRGEYRLIGKNETRTFKEMKDEYLEAKAEKRSVD